MIRRVRVKGYKSLRDVNISLGPLTVILGPNASGKSNLFDALRLLSRLVTSRSLQEAFSDHRGDPIEAFDYGEKGIAELLKQERVEFLIEVDVELSPDTIKRAEEIIQRYREGTKKSHGERASSGDLVKERFLRYRVCISLSPGTGVLRVEEEHLQTLKEKKGTFRPAEKRKPFIEKVGEVLRLRMEGQARPMEYEVGLNYTLVSQPVYPPHYPHLVAFREEVGSWRFYYLEPRLMREENPLYEALLLNPTGDNLAAFYWTLKRKNPAQFRNLELTLNSFVPTIEGIDIDQTPDGRLRLKVREHGIEHSAKVLSEGTLRLLGLMAIFTPSEPLTVVGLEEPENGVHPRRLNLIADLLQNAAENRQVIINTHSPLLPEYLQSKPGTLFIQCSKDDSGTTFLKPLPLKDEGFFRQISIQKVLDEEKTTPFFQQIMRGDFG